MTPEKKKRIIKRFLEESSLNPIVIPEDAVESLPKYAELASALDELEVSHDRFIDFTNVEVELPKWNMLSRVLGSGLTLNADAPGVAECNLGEMRSQVDNLFLDGLPQPDYYNRTTQPDLVTQVATIDPLIASARDKLTVLLADITPPGFDRTRNPDISSLITQINAEIKRAAKAGDIVAGDRAKNQLVVAEDLLKINKLTTMTIPGEHGAGPMTYCTLAEAAGGVTEKVSLVSLARVNTQLGNLRDTPIADVNAYIAHRGDYKLSTEAILKLPKHGRVEEVQREAMALNISRILGLDTTRSSIMTHEGKPALFVPFENIRLMSDFAKGKTLTSISLPPKTYEHYSTVNPVGEGLQADSFVDDFGSALGLFYVCSDPDSIGGYNQNKALRDSRSLFIFDQVVMPSDGFKLDSRISLQPVGAMGHTRHGQGRNRTLLEDSRIDLKFESMMQLLGEQQRIDRYADRTIQQYKAEIERIDRALALPHGSAQDKLLKAQKEQFVALQKDAITLRGAINKRIEAIIPTLPKLGEGLGKADGCQALVLEKLLHNPRLYTDAGRPYKNPWTNRQANPVTRIDIVEPGRLRITFSGPIPIEMAGFLKKTGNLTSLRKPSGSDNQLDISPQDLARLREDMLHPEKNPRMNHDQNYLDIAALKEIGKAYKDGHRTRIINLMDEYRKLMIDDSQSPEVKLRVMDQARIFLQRYIDTAGDKGFGMHVMKKLHFDMQKQLQGMMPPLQKPVNIDTAFEAALKLDRVELFNKVVACAIKNNKLDSLEFRTFLQDCIDQRATATNHATAILASRAVEQAGRGAMMVLNLSLVIPEREEVVAEELDEIDPVEHRRAELEEQRPTLDHIVPSVPPVVHVTPEEVAPREQEVVFRT